MLKVNYKNNKNGVKYVQGWGGGGGGVVNFWYISQLFLVFLLLLWESKYYLGWNGLDLLLQFWIRLYVL